MAVRDVVQAAAGVGGDKLYVEDVFSTYLYTGNGSTQTITNGIDLDGEGGLVWGKMRSGGGNNFLQDTVRGTGQSLCTNNTDGNNPVTNTYINAFNSNGFTLGSNSTVNGSAYTFASWSFRKAPKFFDVVTWTGDGVSGREIPHNLGSVPGCIIVKNLELGTNWIVYHQGANGGVNPEQYSAYLDAANAFMSGGEVVWGDGTTAFAPTSTHFTIYSSNDLNRASSLNTYVAYLFAHNAGGFGDDGEQNVISCGVASYPVSGDVEVNLGWEPQWVLMKDANHSGPPWWIMDTMRGWGAQRTGGTFSSSTGGNLQALFADSADAEVAYNYGGLTSTGFKLPSNNNYGDGNTNYIYIAIRRPMKTPTSGTEVFSVNTTSPAVITAGFPVDAVLSKYNVSNWSLIPRLTVGSLSTSTTSTEVNYSAYASFASNTAFLNNGAENPAAANWMFKRAPGFFDVVAYTGNVVAGRQIPHNLGVVPELMIAKTRDAANYWVTYDAASGPTKFMILNTYNATQTTISNWNDTAPTASVFTVGDGNYTNRNATQQIIYLFASCPGVSKVGSYTGTGADLNVDCGFSAGARFILIKRTDTQINVAPTTGWYVWDSARGIASGNDPYLLLNSAAGQVTSTDYIDPLASGFTVTSSAPAALNASGGSYIFLAIA